MAISKLTGKSLDLGTDAIESFASTGIDDNATSTALTINADGSIVVSDKVQVGGSTGNAYKIYANSNETNQIIGVFNQSAQDSGYIAVSANGTTDFARVRLGANADDMVLFAGGSERMRIDSAGDVGIGTSSPSELLDVGDHTAVGNRNIRISQRTGTGNVTYGGLQFYYNNTAGTEGINAAIYYASGPLRNDGELTFHTGASGSISERLRIDHNGNVRLGYYTSSGSASSLLDLTFVNTNSTEHNAINFQSDNAAGRCYINYARGSSSVRGDLIFGSSNTERMRINYNGDVGIGTSTFNLSTFSDPAVAVGSAASGTRGTIEIASNIITNTAYGILAFTNDSSTDTTNNKRVAQINATRNGNNNASDLDFITNSGSSYDTRMKITAAGNVGIGATPAQKLTVNGLMSFGSTLGDIISLYDNRIGSTNMYGFGVEASAIYYKSLSYHRWYVNQNADTQSYEMELRDEGRLNLRSTTATGPQLYFFDNSSPGLVGNIKFTGSFGNGGGYNSGLQGSGEIQYSAAGHFFADTSVVSYGIPGAWHRMNGDFRWGTYSGSTIITEAILMASSTGNLDIDGTLYQNSASTNSDSKMKENVVTLTDCLNKVSQLRGVEFDWKSEYRRDAGHDIGVIAQEVETVIPEIVTERELQVGIKGNDGETIKSVDYSKFTALLIEAVKELKTQNEALETRIAALETN